MESPVLPDLMLPGIRLDENNLKERKIFLWGQVDDASAKYVIDRLLYLSSEDPRKDITLIINSPGGANTSGMAILDTMNLISNDIRTICMGFAGSFGALLLLSGTKGKRYAYPHSRIMLHQPHVPGRFEAQATDIGIFASMVEKEKKEINRIIAEGTGQPLEIIERDTDRDFWLSAEEAVTYGAIDSVLQTWNSSESSP
ncbi:putative ATP-dependent Clp endopeptidase, proteolytic subunit ClpP [Leptospira inadai serovar Lyme str. 10]|uniref:ATP-dependent Clp protease proteolytic subunit n=2 Tax=Leptospira inadai serovar Lyme TaxID=293084 RepID=V6HB24_9LEPT|nr:ATP-dependent Clp protease proteolytic subunit [Leptospira inadai]EQA36741.1 putative ATP-dependent Clp endopeptidase, proteolytic subunit ClpP [Leptospira inadai serovar Lyme str. 10]PNV75559.1 ATP-dependent Clp protease proteolytic subunit [Leptospira inadai serovar Lyme]